MISISSFLMKSRMLMLSPQSTRLRFYGGIVKNARDAMQTCRGAAWPHLLELRGRHACSDPVVDRPVRPGPGGRRRLVAGPARQPVLPAQRPAAVGRGMGPVATPALADLAVRRLVA